LASTGRSSAEISRQTSVPRSTVRDWRLGRVPTPRLPLAIEVGEAEAYAHLLGLYLGDGYISRVRRTWNLRITLDAAYPRIVEGCRAAIQTVAPGHSVRVVPKGGAVDVSCYWIRWPELFPQHGPGRKHERRIVLKPWQETIVRSHPRSLIRGLFESDGTYCANVVRSPAGTSYSYGRYFFTNRSDDIRHLFAWACDLIDVDTRQGGRHVSVARRRSVGILNEFLGPKQ
jgi:hypothetical protein